MNTILVLFGVLWMVIFIHELGHLLAMRECGVAVKSMMIGIPLPKFTLRDNKWLQEKFGKDFSFTFGLLPLAGGVTPENEDWDQNGDYRSIAYIAGAGPLFNLLACIFTFACMFAVKFTKHATVHINGSTWEFSAWIVASVLFAAVYVLWKLRRSVCAYIFPVIAILLFVVTLKMFIVSWQEMWHGGNIALLAKQADGVKTTIDLILFWVSVNFALGLTNLLPIFPLDGGRIMTRLLEGWLPNGAKFAKGIGLVLVAALVGFCITSDLWLLFSK